MAIQGIQTLKNFFKSLLEPTQENFWDFIDSYYHKYDGVIIKRIEDIGSQGEKQIVFSDNTAVQVSQTSTIPIRVAIIGAWRVFKHPANDILNQIENNDTIEGFFNPDYFSQFKVLDSSDLANLNNLEDLNKPKVVFTNTVKFDRNAGYIHISAAGSYLTGDIDMDLTDAKNGAVVLFKLRSSQRPQINNADYVFYNDIIALGDYELWMVLEINPITDVKTIFISIPKGTAGGSSSIDEVLPFTPEITFAEISTDVPNTPEITIAQLV